MIWNCSPQDEGFFLKTFLTDVIGWYCPIKMFPTKLSIFQTTFFENFFPLTLHNFDSKKMQCFYWSIVFSVESWNHLFSEATLINCFIYHFVASYYAFFFLSNQIKLRFLISLCNHGFRKKYWCQDNALQFL